ncbi:MAG: CRISPR-associated endonuclease Cas1 [Cyanobacteria bacterium J06639_18]
MYGLTEDFLDSLTIRDITFVYDGKLLEEDGKLWHEFVNEKDASYEYKEISENSFICCTNSRVEVSGKLFDVLLRNNINIVFVLGSKLYEYGVIHQGEKTIDYEKIRLEISKQQASVVLRKRRRILQRAKFKDINLTSEDFRQYDIYHQDAIYKISLAQSQQTINGQLGNMMKLYYQLFDKLFHEGMDWAGKRKESIGSSCLNFVERLLENHVRIILLANGINEKISISRHSEKHRKGALIQDLKFEFSPILIDLVCVKVFNQKVLGLSDFDKWVEGDELPEVVRNKLTLTFNKKLESELCYPGTKRKVSHSRMISIQALQIYKISIGKLNFYNPIDTK